jgi:hypothetical protein
LIIAIKIELLSLYKLGNENKNTRSGKKLLPSRILFIGTSKKLNDYYAPRA